jgi:small subunit ribosomal protein S16
VSVKIRLMRVGKKKQPTYRVVVADSRSPRDGRFIEILGQYEPRSEPSVVSIDGDRALAWIEKGAQPTEQVGKLLEITGVWEQYRVKHGAVAASAPKARAAAPAKPEPAPAKAAAPAPAAPAEPASAEAAPAEPAPAEPAPTEPVTEAEAPAEPAAESTESSE